MKRSCTVSGYVACHYFQKKKHITEIRPLNPRLENTSFFGYHCNIREEAALLFGNNTNIYHLIKNKNMSIK